MAILVLAKNSHSRMNRYFALFAGTLAFWSVLNYVSLHPIVVDQLTWIRIVMAVVSLMMLFMLLLANTFPSGTPYFKKIGGWFGFLSAVIALSALSPWLFTDVHYIDGQTQPQPGPAMIPFVAYVLATLALSIGILLRKFLTLKGVAKEYVRYGLIGIIITFLLLLFSNFVVVLAFKSSALVAFSPLVALIFTASFAYGIVRRRLFDVRLIVTRFVAYLLLLLFAGAFYGLLIAVLPFFITGIYPSLTQVLVSTAVVGVLILFVEPLRRFFNHVTREVFYQDDYDTKDILDDLATVLVHATQTKQLAKGSLTILKNALKSDSITLILMDELASEKRTQISVGKPPAGIAALSSEQLRRHVSDVVSVDSADTLPNRFHADIQRLGVSVIVRLETKSEVVGYVLFGYKTTGSAYSQRDVDLIRITGDELAVAIQNTMRFEQIQGFNATLQQRIEEATKELRTSNEQLQKLDEAKDEFVSMASHQLRTPLTSVKGYISMVLEGDAGKISAVQRQLLSEAFTSSERMVHLINDFLNVSRLQTGKFMLEIKPIDLAKVVAQEVDSLQTTAGARGLKLQYKVPKVFPVLYIDEGKIRQVIMNFIDNAIYYSSEETSIRIELTSEGGDAVLKVHDTGIGVPKAEQAHLFTKFFRATNARKQRPDGTGVGLFLAKKVIVAHGGTMVFESVEGEGSTFGFRLPIKKLSAAHDADELNK